MKCATNAKRENYIIRKRALSLFITCLFCLSYFSAFVELAAIPHRILNENGERNFIHVYPKEKSGEEQIGRDKAPLASFSKIPNWSICQIQKNLMNSRSLSPDADCNQFSPHDIITFIFPSPSVVVASTMDVYLFAPKNSPPVS